MFALLYKLYKRNYRKENRETAFLFACIDMAMLSVLLFGPIVMLCYAFFFDFDNVDDSFPYTISTPIFVFLFFYFQKKKFFTNLAIYGESYKNRFLLINMIVILIFALFLFDLIFIPWYIRGHLPWH